MKRKARGWGASGNNSGPTRSRGNVTSREKEDQVVGVGLAPLLVVEDVDEDPQGANATFKGDLVLLSGPGEYGTWGRELLSFCEQSRRKDMRYRVSVSRGCVIARQLCPRLNNFELPLVFTAWRTCNIYSTIFFVH